MSTLPDVVREFEKKKIVTALKRAKGNRSAAARALGIPRSRLYRRLWAYGLEQKGGSHEPVPDVPPGDSVDHP